MIPDILSDNFQRWEFACHGLNCCNHSAPVRPELVTVLQAIRDEFGVEVIINRGFSCLTYNAILGSKPDSWHPLGGAGDCKPLLNIPLYIVYDFARHIPELGGFGFYDYHFHVDIRPRVAGRITVWDRRR